MKRLETISVFGSSFVDYELPKTKSSKYIVDDSHFIPMSEAVKQLSGARPYTDEEIKGMYDFPNGVDSGMKIPVDRMHDVHELPEIQAEIMSQQLGVKDSVDSLERANKKRDKLKELQVALDKSSQSSPNSVNSSSATNG